MLTFISLPYPPNEVYVGDENANRTLRSIILSCFASINYYKVRTFFLAPLFHSWFSLCSWWWFFHRIYSLSRCRLFPHLSLAHPFFIFDVTINQSRVVIKNEQRRRRSVKMKNSFSSPCQQANFFLSLYKPLLKSSAPFREDAECLLTSPPTHSHLHSLSISPNLEFQSIFKRCAKKEKREEKEIKTKITMKYFCHVAMMNFISTFLSTLSL